MAPLSLERNRVILTLAATVALVAAGWWLGASEPSRPPSPSAQLFEAFRRDVVPVLDRRCSACHGVPQSTFAPFERSVEGRALLRWPVDDAGRASTPDQARIAYARCTEPRRVGTRRFVPIDRGSPALVSPLARAPLAEAWSGHAGHPEVFDRPEDSDLVRMLGWIEAEIAAAPEPLPPLDERERFFAGQVTPILVRKTCFGANCHGTRAFNDLKLDPGLPALAERFPPAIARANRLAMLGTVTRLVCLDGAVDQSKQLLKILPLAEGGIVHKGGNTFLEKADADYTVLLEWLKRERAEQCRRADADLGQVRGWVFVRRPTATPERFLEDGAFLGGARLIWRRGDREQVVCGPADIRAPDVAYDGRHVVFAQRLRADEPLNLWEADLDRGSVRQLTFSTDPTVHYLDPLYVPDPDHTDPTRLDAMALVLVSNRAGGASPVSPDGILGEADGGDTTTILDVQRTERAGTFVDRQVQVVRGANVGERRRITADAPGRLSVAPPFPTAVDATTHYVIEQAPRTAPRYDAYRLRRAEHGQEARTFRETLTRMTFSPGQVRRPTLRSSGEVIFTAVRTGWQSGRPFFNGALYRTHVDGSNFHPHYGNRSAIPILADSRELACGLEVRVGRDADSWWGGMLILSDHQFGPTIEPDNPVDNLDHPWHGGRPASAEHSFVPGWVPIDPQATPGGVSSSGAWRDPYPLPDGSIAVAYAPGPIDLADPNAAPNFDLVRLVPKTSFHSADGFAAGEFVREPLVSGPESELWPRAVAARLKEPVRLALHADERHFGAPQRVGSFLGYPPGTPAVLRVFDVVLLDAFFEQSTPVGVRHLALPACPSCGEATPELAQIRHVRVIGARPPRVGEGPEPVRFLIAETPIEADGSVLAAIPSATPFDVQVLNADFMALRWPHRWLYALPGEDQALSVPRGLYAQICAGCHGGLTGRRPDTLRRPDATTSASRTRATWDATTVTPRVPANLAGNRVAAARRVDFEHDVMPILARACVSCHAGDRAAANLNLTGAQAYAALLRWVDVREQQAIRSPLMEKLLGRELWAPGTVEAGRPHPVESPLSTEDVRTWIRWIDLGAQRRVEDL